MWSTLHNSRFFEENYPEFAYVIEESVESAYSLTDWAW